MDFSNQPVNGAPSSGRVQDLFRPLGSLRGLLYRLPLHGARFGCLRGCPDV
jgi:hypothetical protein